MADSFGERAIRRAPPAGMPWFLASGATLRSTNESCCAVTPSVPGSHKSNLHGPTSLYSYDEHQDLVYQEVRMLHWKMTFMSFPLPLISSSKPPESPLGQDCKAGDVVIFTEALTQ